MKSRKPQWLKVKLQAGKEKNEVEKLLKRLTLHTVCEEARCPNLMECFSKKTATFMILGKYCTRHCTFCNVQNGKLLPPEEDEPARVAQAVAELKLKHVVITSVTRDDLPDGGAEQFAAVIREIKNLNRKVTIEVLIPDFKGDYQALCTVVKAKPDIINHNVETVPRLYSEVRPEANYQRSLELLATVKSINQELLTKSGIMLGLGEKRTEIIDIFRDLRKVGCDLLTIGQYLAPSTKHHPVVEYLSPDIFAEYKKIGEEMGFCYVAAGPLVRSSYKAAQAVQEIF